MSKNRNLIHSDHWETPSWLYDQLDREFHFTFDPCPLHATFDGLTIEWGSSNFVNPPYIRKAKEAFVKKGIEESKKGKLSVFILPVSTSSDLFHDHIKPNASEIRFLRRRISFKGINTKGEKVDEGNSYGGMHDSMIVVFSPHSSHKKIKQMSNTLTIKKVKLIKGDRLEIGFDASDNGKIKHVTEKHDAPVHKDLIAAMSALTIHWALINELIPMKSVRSLDKVDPKLLENLNVYAYSIGGKTDDEGVVISGTKKLASGKQVVINTPFTRFEEGEETAYKYISELNTAIEDVEDETLQYVEEGKVGEDPQSKIEFPEEEEELVDQGEGAE